MLGDTAIAVHPDDERYRAPGRHRGRAAADRPPRSRSSPTTHVDPKFGTGAVKVTPAHDPNDFEIGQRHDLPMLTIMDGRGDHHRHGPFEGLDRFEARAAIVAALRARGPDRRGEAAVPAHRRALRARAARSSSRGCRCSGGSRSSRWPRPPVDAVRDGRTMIHPAELNQRYFDWVDNMHDWCISRQLWWGHRIPVWYGPNGEVVCVGPDDEAPDREGWRRTRTCSTPGSPRRCGRSPRWAGRTHTEDLEKFYPTCVLSPATTSCSSGSPG